MFPRRPGAAKAGRVGWCAAQDRPGVPSSQPARTAVGQSILGPMVQPTEGPQLWSASLKKGEAASSICGLASSQHWSPSPHLAAVATAAAVAVVATGLNASQTSPYATAKKPIRGRWPSSGTAPWMSLADDSHGCTCPLVARLCPSSRPVAAHASHSTHRGKHVTAGNRRWLSPAAGIQRASRNTTEPAHLSTATCLCRNLSAERQRILTGSAARVASRLLCSGCGPGS